MKTDYNKLNRTIETYLRSKINQTGIYTIDIVKELKTQLELSLSDTEIFLYLKDIISHNSLYEFVCGLPHPPVPSGFAVIWLKHKPVW